MRLGTDSGSATRATARRLASVLTAFTALALLALPASPAAGEGIVVERPPAESLEAPGIGGRVLAAASPLETARVYVYQLADLTLRRGMTDELGRFLFDGVPAGLYKVIAHKPGFLPAVVMITRATGDAKQFLELELAPEDEAAGAAGSGFWEARAQVPPDVLREIEAPFEPMHLAAEESGGDWPVLAARLPQAAGGERFSAEMEAVTGVDQVDSTDAQITGGRLDLEGRFGAFMVGLEGDFRQWEPGAAETATGTSAEASAFTVAVDRGERTQVRLTSSVNHWDGAAPSGEPTAATGMIGAGDDVAFEHHRVSVSQMVGAASHSHFAAQYTRQSNFHRHGWIDPAGIPEESRSLRFEGSFSTPLGETTHFETGVRYRQDDLVFTDAGLSSAFGVPVRDRVDLFGRADTRIHPAMLVEYGLYTTLTDGSLSLRPQGGLVLSLGDGWQAAGRASQKVHDAAPSPHHDFATASFTQDASCELGQEFCYRLELSHRGRDEEAASFEVAATHRGFDDTVRLYFDDDFFDRLESLYLVPGDRLPELSMGISRRISPRVLTRLESNVGYGGGGTFVAADRSAYENEVSYLVTSLDTRFTGSSTGVFVAFHKLEQQLDSLADGMSSPDPLAIERFQVRLTQDLNALVDLATDWAIRLNMELSRGANTLDPQDDELRKRILGGIAVRF